MRADLQGKNTRVDAAQVRSVMHAQTAVYDASERPTHHDHRDRRIRETSYLLVLLVCFVSLFKVRPCAIWTETNMNNINNRQHFADFVKSHAVW